MKSLSLVRLFATPWTVAYQAPPSMGFSRQECWSGLPFPSPGDCPAPGIKPGSPALQAEALPSEPPLLITQFHHKGEIRWEMCVGHLTHSKNRVQAASTAQLVSKIFVI